MFELLIARGAAYCSDTLVMIQYGIKHVSNT